LKSTIHPGSSNRYSGFTVMQVQKAIQVIRATKVTLVLSVSTTRHARLACVLTFFT